MRIAVMGAGAVGLLYGGWLQMAGAEVTFIARGSRLLALRNQPLTAVGRVPFRLDSVDVVESVAKLAPVDVLLLATKLYDLQAAAVSGTACSFPNRCRRCSSKRHQCIPSAQCLGAFDADRCRPRLRPDKNDWPGVSSVWRH